jgi:hypothetical protein
VLGCLITTAIIYQGFPNLPGALETIDVQNMTQVIVPGSADIMFPKNGAYAVNYEYRSLVVGVQSINAKTYPPLICFLPLPGQRNSTESRLGFLPQQFECHTGS